MRRLLLVTACLAMMAPAGARAASTTITVLNEGTMLNTLEFADTLGGHNQDSVKCAAHDANHHTHAALPGEGHDTQGWCDNIEFRTFVVTVPATDGDGRPVGAATMNVALHFASGNEPPTDQLPKDEKSRGTCDAELTVAQGATQVAGTLNAPGWMPFSSPHTISLPVTPGQSYTLVVDPFLGPHMEWHLDATLTLTGAQAG